MHNIDSTTKDDLSMPRLINPGLAETINSNLKVSPYLLPFSWGLCHSHSDLPPPTSRLRCSFLPRHFIHGPNRGFITLCRYCKCVPMDMVFLQMFVYGSHLLLSLIKQVLLHICFPERSQRQHYRQWKRGQMKAAYPKAVGKIWRR